MTENHLDTYKYGCSWARVDFHIHTKSDKEFKYNGEEGDFVKEYVDSLKSESIRVATITNHNKFNLSEYKALKKRARKEGIFILPGVELSVGDGANGVHTLITFSDQWLKDGKDLINVFLSTAFSPKVPAEYENENGRCSHNITTILEILESYNKDFFVIFAHVEASSGLWKELDGGRIEELSRNALIKKYCLGFQKVRTHDKPKTKCRTLVKTWWKTKYPAEVEGCDAKSIKEIGNGKPIYLKLGEPSFESIKHALTDHEYRVTNTIPDVKHSHIKCIRFEGGLLDGESVSFSPHVNCLIGIRGSGNSSVLEAIRYALGIECGKGSMDKEYKDKLIPYVLKSGGKIVVEAVDKHGEVYEIVRILKQQSEVYIAGEHHPGVSIRETIIWKPLFFGQKDLAAAGEGFGNDLVDKLVGESLKPVRGRILTVARGLRECISELTTLESDAEQLSEEIANLADVTYRLEQFDKLGVNEILKKQLEFDKDISYCTQIEKLSINWLTSIKQSVKTSDESFSEVDEHSSVHNKEYFNSYNKITRDIKSTIASTGRIIPEIEALLESQSSMNKTLLQKKVNLNEVFAKTERELADVLLERGALCVNLQSDSSSLR